MGELVVYETRESIELEMDLASIQLPDWVVLVSPSGARAALPLLGQGRSFKLVAIGATTRDEILRLGFNVAGVASKPTPDGLQCAKVARIYTSLLVYTSI